MEELPSNTAVGQADKKATTDRSDQELRRAGAQKRARGLHAPKTAGLLELFARRTVRNHRASEFTTRRDESLEVCGNDLRA
jgi:hypothetical protein